MTLPTMQEAVRIATAGVCDRCGRPLFGIMAAFMHVCRGTGE